MVRHKREAPKERPLQWHPENYAGLQIELADEKEFLIFEDEHQLGTKPKAIDILFIKKVQEHKIKKNIGRIFRKHNIIEYKSPDDYLSIDDFYKVYGYACFYKADTPSVNSIPIHELIITFISRQYPRKLLHHLTEEQNYTIQKIEKGIYYLVGNSIPIQFVVTSKLSSEKNLWLKGLTNHLKDMKLTEALAEDYQKHKSNTLYQSAMDIIMRANKEHFNEEVNTVCEALGELVRERYADEIAEAALKASQKVNSLILQLSELGRTDDILKSAADPEYQQKLFEEFNL